MKRLKIYKVLENSAEKFRCKLHRYKKPAERDYEETAENRQEGDLVSLEESQILIPVYEFSQHLVIYEKDKGIPFICRIVNKGDRTFPGSHTNRCRVKYGWAVHVYDGRYPQHELGQFVADYYVSTLLEGYREDTGLNLHGGIPDWTIGPVGRARLQDFLMRFNIAFEDEVYEVLEEEFGMNRSDAQGILEGQKREDPKLWATILEQGLDPIEAAREIERLSCIEST